jgi:threonine dehydrogenase-like Zn-dependent dehydrogenase
MKALVYTGPYGLEFREQAEPCAEVDEVLVKVEAVGICGSDMHAYHDNDSRRPAPLILGHEAAGHIISGTRSGQRVTINPLVICGKCSYCIAGRGQLCRKRQIISMPPRPGAFAEIVRVPERNLIAVPDGFSITKAALAEPIAVAYHAVHRGMRFLANPLPAATCVVLGGGAIGLAAALVLRMEGATSISVAETNSARRATIQRSGDFHVYSPEVISRPDDSSVDLLIDAVGVKASREAASGLIKPGGVIVHAGLSPGSEGLDVRKITLEEIVVTGTYCYTPDDFRNTVSALTEGRLGSLDWYQERSLKEGPSAFKDLDEGHSSPAKIILHP